MLVPDGFACPDIVGALPSPAGATVVLRHPAGPTPTFYGIYELARAADEALSEGAHGVVIVHEAGTVAEAAWALEVLYEGAAPVVLTAASGGAAGLADAVAVAATGTRGLGCPVVAHGEIHAARYVTTVGGVTAPAFASPAAGPLGHVIGGRPRLLWRPPERFTVRGPLGGRSPRVGLHTVTLGDDGELLRALARHCDGLVVAAPAAEGPPDPLAPILAELAGRISVVFSSPAARGEGTIQGTALDPGKARILMHLLLDAGRDRATVLEAFAALDRGDTGRF